MESPLARVRQHRKNGVQVVMRRHAGNRLVLLREQTVVVHENSRFQWLFRIVDELRGNFESLISQFWRLFTDFKLESFRFE